LVVFDDINDAIDILAKVVQKKQADPKLVVHRLPKEW
jgi:hypothetical protein